MVAAEKKAEKEDGGYKKMTDLQEIIIPENRIIEPLIIINPENLSPKVMEWGHLVPKTATLRDDAKDLPN